MSESVERNSDSCPFVSARTLPPYYDVAVASRSDQRRHPRYEVDDVRGRLRATLEGEVFNLSVRGMALRTESWLSPGRTYTLKLVSGDREISLTGTVARCRLASPGLGSESAAVYEAGFEFEDVVSEQAEEVLQLIVARGISHVEREAFGHFTLRDDQGLVLETTPEFVVRKLSRSGLLIESEYVPAPEEHLEAEIRLEDRVLHAELRVAYVHQIEPVEGRPCAEIGVEVVDMPAEDRAALEDLIEGLLGG